LVLIAASIGVEAEKRFWVALLFAIVAIAVAPRHWHKTTRRCDQVSLAGWLRGNAECAKPMLSLTQERPMPTPDSHSRRNASKCIPAVEAPIDAKSSHGDYKPTSALS
jgi:hypothetical protein